jgi:hypothetical protein
VGARRCICLALVLLVAGCGGSDDKQAPNKASAPATGVAQPKPKEPIGVSLKRVNAAQAARDCKRLTPLTFSILREQLRPGLPATAAECRGFDKATRGQKPAVFDKTAEYGTAAFMEGPPTTSAKGIRSQSLWALDSDGVFRFTRVSGQGTEQIGTRPAPGTKIAANADAFLAGVRRHDCRLLATTINPNGRLASAGKGVPGACKVVLKGKLFEPALRESPGARAVKLGATRSFAFYGVSTKKAYFTLLMRLTSPKQQDEMTVMDVLPNTPIKPAG